MITPFTVESYKWLQPDAEGASSTLLAHISLQLSKLTFTSVLAGATAPVVLNTTTPALSLPDVHQSSSLGSSVIPINILWFLSLALSLISAFFAITAQQWLRQLRLPPKMPVRRAVHLLAIRKDGLTTWQVPSIISLLPLLLQVAVVLFLSGLFLLLKSLNAGLTIAFGAVALIGLLAFLATIVLPLITAHCPYKSPLVPTVIFVLQCLSYPVAMVPALFIVLYKVPEGLTSHQSFALRDKSDNARKTSSFRDTPNFWTEVSHNIIVSYVQSFGRHMVVDMGQFWLSREHRYVFNHVKQADLEQVGLEQARFKRGLEQTRLEQARLERSSLIQTFLSTSARRSSKVLPLLDRYGGDTPLQGFHDTVVYSLRAFRAGLRWSHLIPEFRLNPKLELYIGKWFSARHRRLLWQYLQQRHWEQDGKVTYDDSDCLIVFHELDNTFPTMRQQYVKHLLRIWAEQRLSECCETSEAIPACLVFDSISTRGYIPDKAGEYSVAFILE